MLCSAPADGHVWLARSQLVPARPVREAPEHLLLVLVSRGLLEGKTSTNGLLSNASAAVIVHASQ